ncbi:MAG: hypothetical protein WCK02_04425 [Bacteroidota bacterium]
MKYILEIDEKEKSNAEEFFKNASFIQKANEILPTDKNNKSKLHNSEEQGTFVKKQISFSDMSNCYFSY